MSESSFCVSNHVKYVLVKKSSTKVPITHPPQKQRNRFILKRLKIVLLFFGSMAAFWSQDDHSYESLAHKLMPNRCSQNGWFLPSSSGSETSLVSWTSSWHVQFSTCHVPKKGRWVRSPYKSLSRVTDSQVGLRESWIWWWLNIACYRMTPLG